MEYERDERLIWRIRLGFQGQTVVVGVDEDTDGILLSLGAAPRDPIVDASETEPWRSAIGKPLFCAWLMTNVYGICDGLQLEFAENVSDTHVTLQMIGVGSTIQLCGVQRFGR